MTFRIIFSAALAAIFLTAAPVEAALAASSGMAMAAGKPTATAGDIEISGPFARATLPGAPAGGGYLTLSNEGRTADKLVSASSPAAGTVSLHAMSMNGSVMQMRALPDGLDIPAGATVKLTPDGLHLMFEHLKGPFVEGKTVPVTLRFQKGGEITVQLSVLGIAAKGPAAAGGSIAGMNM